MDYLRGNSKITVKEDEKIEPILKEIDVDEINIKSDTLLKDLKELKEIQELNLYLLSNIMINEKKLLNYNLFEDS
jgi:mevalonate kinase